MLDRDRKSHVMRRPHSRNSLRVQRCEAHVEKKWEVTDKALLERNGLLDFITGPKPFSMEDIICNRDNCNLKRNKAIMIAI